MKLKIYLIIIAALLGWFAPMHSQSLGWVRTAGSQSSEIGYDLAIDPAGNIYSTGLYYDDCDFDPNMEGFELEHSVFADFFIQKHDNNGNFLWVKGFGGVDNDLGLAIDVDNEGNVYATGSFSDTVDFDPGPGVFNLVTNGSFTTRDVFIMKLDSDGNLAWAVHTPSLPTYTGFGNDIRVDAAGNVFVVGFFTGTVDFDPGPEVFNLSSDTNANRPDCFVLKLDNDGNFVWAKRIGGQKTDVANALVLDPAGNLYIGGTFASFVDFNPGPGLAYLISNATLSDAFILKLDNDGNFAWVKAIVTNYVASIFALALDTQGNIHATGSFSGTTDFDPGSGLFNLENDVSQQMSDIFIQKLDPNGNFIWAVGMGGIGQDRANAITVDEGGFVYTTGTFGHINLDQISVDFDPGPGVFFLSNEESESDIFVQKLDANGNFVWAQKIGRGMLTYNEAHDIEIDQNKNLLIFGTYQDGDFDPGSGEFFQPTAGSFGAGDAFLLKWLQCAATTHSLDVSTCEEAYSLNGQTYAESGVYIQTLTNVSGCDSILTLNLTITSVDASVMQEATTLTANAADAQYQWVDCNNNFEPIPDATNQSFTPSVSGNYAVVVVQNGCPATSECYSVTVVGTEETTETSTWLVYPNPTSGRLSIAVPDGMRDGITLEMRNALGQLVWRETASFANAMDLELDLAKGVYTATILSGERKKAVRLVVN